VTAGRFRILHVCTGNIGRSPMAERLMQLRLRQRLGTDADAFHVESAGTWGQPGAPMEPFADEAVRELGADPDGFQARDLQAVHIELADLVLTATVEHRAAVVATVPSAVRRVFTLKEFARLGAAVEPSMMPIRVSAGGVDAVDYAAAAVHAALTLRGPGERLNAGADDVADPIGAPYRVYQARAREIDLAVGQCVRVLATR
jgi:protein-tyrosine phosphatase